MTIFSMMKLVFISTILSVSSAANTWINNPDNGKDYMFVSDCIYGQGNAETACVTIGGTLAIANSDDIRSFIVNNVYDGTSSTTSCAGWQGLWTDGTLNDATDTITFSDGTTDSFANVDWDNEWNEPNYISSQPCFGFRRSTLEWHSVICSERNAFICEKEGDTTNPTENPSQQPTFSSTSPTSSPSATPSQKPTDDPTANPTAVSSLAPTPSPYEIIEVQGSYICGDLTMNIDLLYGVSYDECVYEQCFVNYAGICAMVNYLADTSPTRCYIMDKQCAIYNDSSFGGKIAIIGDKDYCIDYPSDWTDRLSDTCATYSDLLGYCEFGEVNTNVTSIAAIESVANIQSGLSALDVCCDCGGGVDVIDNVTIYFGTSMDNSLCSWPYGNPSNGNVYRTWDNLKMYELCVSLMEKVQSPDMDCNILIDKSYGGIINFFICDFDGYEQDTYFIYTIAIETDITNVLINKDWFLLDYDLFATKPKELNYIQCVSLFNDIGNANIYTIIPCDADSLPVTYEQTAPTSTSPLPSTSATSPIRTIIWLITLMVIIFLLVIVIFVIRYKKKTKQTSSSYSKRN